MNEFGHFSNGGPVPCPHTDFEPRPASNEFSPSFNDILANANHGYYSNQINLDYDHYFHGHSGTGSETKEAWFNGTNISEQNEEIAGTSNNLTSASSPYPHSYPFTSRTGDFSLDWITSDCTGNAGCADQSIKGHPSYDANTINIPQYLQSQCATENVGYDLAKSYNFEDCAYVADKVSGSLQNYAGLRCPNVYPTPPPSRASGCGQPYGPHALKSHSKNSDYVTYYTFSREDEEPLDKHTCAYIGSPDAYEPTMLRSWEGEPGANPVARSKQRLKTVPAKVAERKNGKKREGKCHRDGVRKNKAKGKKPSPPLPKGADLRRLLAIGEFSGQEPQVSKAELARRHNTSANNVLQNAKNNVKAWAGSPEKFKQSWGTSKSRLASLQNRSVH